MASENESVQSNEKITSISTVENSEEVEKLKSNEVNEYSYSLDFKKRIEIKNKLIQSMSMFFFIAFTMDLITIVIVDVFLVTTIPILLLGGLLSLLEAFLFTRLFIEYYRNFSQEFSKLYISLPIVHFIVYSVILFLNMSILGISYEFFVDLMIPVIIIGIIHIYARFMKLTPMKIINPNFGEPTLNFDLKKDKERKETDLKNEKEKLTTNLYFKNFGGG